MDNRITAIKDMIMQACERLKKDGISVDASTIDALVEKYTAEGISEMQAKHEIRKVERAVRTKHEISVMLGSELEVARNLQNLHVQHKGITLNMQDIDLMMIATSESVEELNLALSKITNVSGLSIGENESFEEYRQRVFDSYLDSLTSRNAYNAQKSLEMIGKLRHLGENVSPEEMAVINSVVGATAKEGHSAIVRGLIKELADSYESETITREVAEKMAKARVDDYLHIMREYSPIEKEGIKESSIEAWQELHRQVIYFYDSITIDEEAKYGKLILQNGTFEGSHLRKTLDFAKSMGKTVRINTLMFYMDCPDDIYEMEVSPTATMIAKEKLGFYVDEATKLFAEYPDTVRSVDIFNELLNRHPVVGMPYTLRSNFPQENADDNTKAGWLKHLDLDDLCEIMAIARGNLPNVDFMYNDDFLTDPEKMSATIQLVEELQGYGRRHGVTLIDSIGTQMHLDNDVTKEEIRNMFLSLKTLGLPIEITEFDLAMTSGVEGLSPEQIEVLRQKKINEIFEVVEELKGDCNIRGFTIWSKTDSQNFRVDLANMQLISDKKTPISTLHGGMFTEGMVPKSAVMAAKCRKQNFNYHGHTSRCGHASGFSDESYVLAARNQGIKRIGFSDHVPFESLENWQQGQRMHESEIDGYIASIRKLQEDNPDMVIRCGFEAEYDPSKKGYLAELRKSCDYMILGQHYVQQGMGLASKKDPEYPIVYANMVCDAIKTGIFDIVAHPDYFMLARDSFETEEARTLFMENARKASHMICQTAVEMGIPLELNARGATSDKKMDDGEYGYPHSLFWRVAEGYCNSPRMDGKKLLVIYAADAHHPGHIMSIDEDRELVEKKIDTSKLKFVSDEYDPVMAREDNLSLQDAYEESLETAVSYETSMIQMLISGVDISEGDSAYERIGEALSHSREKCSADCIESLRKIDEKLATLDDYSSYSEEKKALLREKGKLKKERIIETCEARERAIDRAQVSLSEAHEIGCETKEEFVQVVGYLTEEKTSSNPVAIQNANDSIDAFKESKSESKTDVSSIGEKPKTLVYKPAESGNSGGDGNSSSDGGFASSINLLLVIGMLVLFGIVAYFMIR